MKSLLVLALSLLLLGSVSYAAEIVSDNGDGSSWTVTWDHGRYPVSITQNNDPSILDAGGYSCGNTLYNYNTDQWALRRFQVAEDNAIFDPITVQSIDWGVRRFVTLLDSIPCDYNVTVYVGTIAIGEPLLFANITWVDQVLVPIAVTNVNVPYTTVMNNAVVDPSLYDIVVAFFAPSSEFIPGCPNTRFACSASNAPGDTRYCYYAFADCGFPEPVTPPELNPNSPEVAKLVVILNGEVGTPPEPGACCIGEVCSVILEPDCLAQGGVWYGGPCTPGLCPPIPVESTSWGRVKDLYR